MPTLPGGNDVIHQSTQELVSKLMRQESCPIDCFGSCYDFLFRLETLLSDTEILENALKSFTK